MGDSDIKDMQKFFQHFLFYSKNFPWNFLTCITSIQCTDKAVEDLTF